MAEQQIATDLEMALATRWYQYRHDGRRFTHMWSFRTTLGGVHLHLFEAKLPSDIVPEWLGGYEAHYLSPPDYMPKDTPSQEHCWLLEARCWHDGTSLWASEFWVPFWRQAPNDHDRIFDEMIRREHGRFIVTGIDGED